MRRILFAAALAAALAPTSPAHLLDPLWSFLSTLWAAPSGFDAGCGFDPNGNCNPAPQPQLDAGCGADPDGLCKPGS